jgi:hypothetical protein
LVLLVFAGARAEAWFMLSVALAPLGDDAERSPEAEGQGALGLFPWTPTVSRRGHGRRGYGFAHRLVQFVR